MTFIEELKSLGIRVESLSIFKDDKRLTAFAMSDSPVLIIGATGTGKESYARALHRASGREGSEPVSINCGAIPESLIESVLFGHVKGAFTGATVDKKGYIETAEGGTLFLDEIGDAPAAVQVKLLRFLDTGEFYPVGGTVPKKANVRLIAATNKKISSASERAECSFRDDLFYRLSTVIIKTESLPYEPEAKMKIVKEILGVLAKGYQGKIKDKKGEEVKNFKHEKIVDYIREKKQVFTRDAERLILDYAFPGNFRELKAVLENALISYKARSGRGPLDACDLERLKSEAREGSGVVTIQDSDFFKHVNSQFMARYHTLIQQGLSKAEIARRFKLPHQNNLNRIVARGGLYTVS